MLVLLFLIAAKLRELLRKLAKRWGVDFVLPRIEYVEGAPAVVTIEETDWDAVDSLDVLIPHVLAGYVPDLQALFNTLGFALDKEPQRAPGDGTPEPRLWARGRSRALQERIGSSRSSETCVF